MKTKFYLFLSAIVLALFSSCSSSSSEEDTFLTVDVNQLYFEGQQGVSASLNIQSNAKWNIAGIPSWLQASSTSGEGDAHITFTTLSSNKSSQELNATISISTGNINREVTVYQSGLNASNCSAEPNLIVALSNVVACDFNYDTNVKYFYCAIGTSSWDDRMTDDEIITKISSNVSDRMTPSDGYVISFSSLSERTKYNIYTVAFDNNGKHGDLIRKSITTKSSSNQAQATFTSVSYTTSQWKWTTKTNAYTDYYYMWFVANTHPNLYYNSDGIVAWFFKQLLDEDVDKSDFTPIKNGGDWYITKDGNYFDAITWAVGSDGELSGVVNRYKGSVSKSSSMNINIPEGSFRTMYKCRKSDIIK